MNSLKHQVVKNECFCRFRRFELGGKNLKVLDEETPGGGLVAEFGHMVWCCLLHQCEGFRILRVHQSVCGCLHMMLKKNGCITLVWLNQIFKKRTWWVKVLAHIVLTVLIFIHVALSFYEMFFNWTKMFFFRSSRKLKEESKDHLRYEKFNIQTRARIIGHLPPQVPPSVPKNQADLGQIQTLP